MKAVLVGIFVLSISSGFAKGFNYTCSGKDRQKKDVVITLIDLVANDVAVDVIYHVNSVPKIYKDVDVYGGDEGYDYGITTKDFMLWITKRPHGLGNFEIAGSYFAGKNWELNNRKIFECVEY